MSRKSLGQSTISGLLWLLIQSIGGRLVSLLTQLILAKLLLPEQFGVVSIAYVITGLAGTLTDFGVQNVVLQRDKAFKLWALPTFWTSLALGFLGLLVVLVAGPIFARLYNSPEVTTLTSILALSMPISALSTLPSIKMRQDLNFKFPALYGTIENLVIQIATVGLAYSGAGALSFVLPSPIFALIRAVIYWVHSPVRISGSFRLLQFRYLIGTGSSIFISSLLITVVGQADYAILGLFADHEAVGFYYFAFRLAIQPVTMLAGNFTNVLFPALVQTRNDPHRQIASSMKAARLLSYVILPVCFGQAAIAKPVLTYLFGHKWDSSILLIVILSVGLPFDAVSWVGGCLLSARRQFRRQMVISLIALPVFLTLITLGSYYGQARGTALAVTFYYLIYGPTYSIFVFRSCGASPSDVADLFLKAPMIAGLTIFGSWWASTLLFPFGGGFGQPVCTIVVGSVTYVAAVYVLERKVLVEIHEAVGFAKLLRKLGFVQKTEVKTDL